MGGKALSFNDPMGLNPAVGCALGAWIGSFGCGAGAVLATGGAFLVATNLTGDTPKQCEQDEPKCSPPEGTICYFQDIVPPAKTHYPFKGTHYHLYKHNKIAPSVCKWNKFGIVDILPPNAIACPFLREGGR